MNAVYNDIHYWNYKDLVDVFRSMNGRKFQVRTKKELDALFRDAEFCDSKVLQIVEVYMPREDAPEALKVSAKVAAQLNDANGK